MSNMINEDTISEKVTNKKTSNNGYSEYEASIHRVGKIWTALALMLILGVPTAVCLYFDVWPPWNQFFVGLIGVVAIFLPVGIIEFLTFSSMVGAGSSYLMFVTGNIAALKAPCALNAMEISGVAPGSKEGDVISTIAIAVSSIVTDLIIIIGVIGLSFIRPVLELPVMQPAFNNVLPALFGALGMIWIKKYYKIAIIPSIVMLALFVFVPTKYLGIMVPLGAIIAILCARYLYKRGKV
jgi:hypothetical protein